MILNLYISNSVGFFKKITCYFFQLCNTQVTCYLYRSLWMSYLQIWRHSIFQTPLNLIISFVYIFCAVLNKGSLVNLSTVIFGIILPLLVLRFLKHCPFNIFKDTFFQFKETMMLSWKFLRLILLVHLVMKCSDDTKYYVPLYYLQ